MENTTEFENALNLELTRLVAELSDLAVHNTDTDDWEIKTEASNIDDADTNLVADSAEQAETDVSTLAELENQFRHLQIALRKIELGTYGICEISGEQISVDRLRANPSARTCQDHMNEESNLPL